MTKIIYLVVSTDVLSVGNPNIDSRGDEVVYGGGGGLTPEVDPPDVFTRPEVDVLMKLTLLLPTFPVKIIFHSCSGNYFYYSCNSFSPPIKFLQNYVQNH